MKNISYFFSLIAIAFLIIQACNSPKIAKKEAVDNCIDKSKIKPDAFCTKEYKPVCACDGKTYANPCMAEKAGIKTWTKGKCSGSGSCIDPSKIKPEQPCVKIYRPVCGCDGKTYNNDCLASKAGVTEWQAGKCIDCVDSSKKKPNQACPRNYQPVCACDGRTYSNQCEAEKEGLKYMSPGICGKCIDPNGIKPNKPCPDLYDPVCGCNQKTYSNPCAASNAGVKIWVKGKCKGD